MYYSTNHTIYLQDGSLFNFRKRFKKHASTLIQAFSKVIDGRSKFGKRHPLPLILALLFGGITAGNSTVKDCQIWALHNQKWLTKILGSSGMPHGIPDQRTLSRTIQKINIDSLVRSYLYWSRLLYGLDSSLVASFDGKTLNGVHGKERIKHILSLFSHSTHQILGQVGVTQKENEIPAFKRLLLEQQPFVSGMLLVGDALHTQKETIRQILASHAGYLLFAKGNQETLETELETFFNHLPFQSVIDETTDHDNQREREITSQITISWDQEMADYLAIQGWVQVKTIGKISRTGIRKTTEGRKVPLSETVYLISSRKLSARQTAQICRNHWCIENNLHWQKDYTFLEDRQTLRSGNAPQVMTFLKSMCLSLFNLKQFLSPTETVSNFQKNTILHHSFLRMAGII